MVGYPREFTIDSRNLNLLGSARVVMIPPHENWEVVGSDGPVIRVRATYRPRWVRLLEWARYALGKAWARLAHGTN